MFSAIKFRRRSKNKLIFILLLLILISTSVLFYISTKSTDLILLPKNYVQETTIKVHTSKTVLTVAVVVCKDRLQEALMMIKSALIFNQPNDFLHFIIFPEQTLKTKIKERLEEWSGTVQKTFDFEFHDLWFPKLEKEWISLYKPCASQRLFFPSLLLSTDSLLYVDTDVLFLSPASDIYDHFSAFDAQQIAALVPYNKEAFRIANSGVMLMNLTRMRTFQWEVKVDAVYEDDKADLKYGDQDIINRIFFDYPELLYDLDCTYNYQPQGCNLMNCKKSDGIKIMHGIKGYFHSKQNSVFRTVYQKFQKYEFSAQPFEEIRASLKSILKHWSQKRCVDPAIGGLDDELWD